MIRRLTALAAILAIGGCATTESGLSVDEAGAARAAQTPPDLVAVAQALNARQGQSLGGGLSILGASAEGRQLAMRFRHERDAGAFSPADREGYGIVAARTIREQMCAQAATRRFVEEYDGVAASIVTADDQPLAAVEITEC